MKIKKKHELQSSLGDLILKPEKPIQFPKRRTTDLPFPSMAKKNLEKVQRAMRHILAKSFDNLPETDKEKMLEIATSLHLSQYEQTRAWLSVMRGALMKAKTQNARANLLESIEELEDDMGHTTRSLCSRRKKP